ncbi:MAG: HU family DNA-binding protein [Pseudomonadota bacterium]
MTDTTYTRSDLIEAVYEACSVTRSDATLLFDTFIEGVIELLRENNEFKVPKFGTFVLKDKAERTGRNPKTGEEVLIAAHKAVSFKPAPALKTAVEENVRPLAA